MKHLEEVVDDYLQTQTNYAFLITGSWGVGKTFFFKNTLEKLIENTDIINDATKKYIPVYISLFGIESIRDVQTKMLLSIFPILKSKAMKLSLTMAKLFTRGLLEASQLGNVDGYFEDLKESKTELIDLSRLVLCFDDLERISKEFPIEVLIGYINTLIDENDTKVILIANEGKIAPKEYSTLKEKLIGITVNYIPDFDSNRKKIIDLRYSSFRSYSEFLTENDPLLKSLNKAFDSNLRTLIFALDKLQTIYSSIENELSGAKKKDSILSKKIEEVVRFSLSISIEFKNSKISYTDRKSIDKSGKIDWNDFDVSQITPDDKVSDNDKKSYRQHFIDKYYSKSPDYKYFESIYAFITGAKPFEADELIKEINDYYLTIDINVIDGYAVMHKLNSHLDLPEYEYREQIAKAVEYARKGELDSGNILNTLHLATRFNNPLKYNVDRLCNKLKRGMILSFKNGKSNVFDVEMTHGIPNNTPYTKHFVELRDLAVELDKKYRKIAEHKRSKELVGLMLTDWEKFFATINDPKETLSVVPVFETSSDYLVYRYLSKTSLKLLDQFIRFLRGRYTAMSHPNLKSEITFWKALSNRLEPRSKIRQRNNRRNFILNQIKNQIDELIDLLTKIQLASIG